MNATCKASSIMPIISIIWSIRAKLYMKKEGIKYVFYQDIFRASDGKVCLKGIVETVCVVNGRLSDSELFDRLFAPYLNPCESV